MDRTFCHLAFKGRCLEAFEHYADLLDGSVEEVCLRDEQGPTVSLAVLRVQGRTLTGHDRQMDTDADNDVALMLCAGDLDDAWALYHRLARDGQITRPMGRTRWARLAGGFIDRYGTAWIVCHGIHDGTARLFARRPRMTLDVLPRDRGLQLGGAHADEAL